MIWRITQIKEDFIGRGDNIYIIICVIQKPKAMVIFFLFIQNIFAGDTYLWINSKDKILLVLHFLKRLYLGFF